MQICSKAQKFIVAVIAAKLINSNRTVSYTLLSNHVFFLFTNINAEYCQLKFCFTVFVFVQCNIN